MKSLVCSFGYYLNDFGLPRHMYLTEIFSLTLMSLFLLYQLFMFGFILLFLIAEPDVLKEVKQKLETGSVKFEVMHLLK